MTEKQFITKLQKWFKYNIPESFVWEAKVIKKNRYNFKSDKSFWKELRILKNSSECFIHKHSDIGMYGTACDGVKIFQGQGFFVMKWDVKRNDKTFFIIKAEILDHFIKQGNKSISREEAKKISYKEGKLI